MFGLRLGSISRERAQHQAHTQRASLPAIDHRLLLGWAVTAGVPRRRRRAARSAPAPRDPIAALSAYRGGSTGSPTPVGALQHRRTRGVAPPLPRTLPWPRSAWPARPQYGLSGSRSWPQRASRGARSQQAQSMGGRRRRRRQRQRQRRQQHAQAAAAAAPSLPSACSSLRRPRGRLCRSAACWRPLRATRRSWGA